MTTDGPAALRMLAGDFELTKAACWNEGDTASMWTLAAAWDAERVQAADDRAALERARALLPEELVECVWNGRGYKRCGCANVDKDNHCMYCLYPPWAHDLAATLGGAR